VVEPAEKSIHHEGITLASENLSNCD
jgi:hypothetical protein